MGRIERKQRLTKTWVVAALASVCCMLWGSAIPVIKTGYRLLSLDSADTASQIVFAGIRFTAGRAVGVSICLGAEEKGDVAGSKDFKICLSGLPGSDGGTIFFLLYRSRKYIRCEKRNSDRIRKFYRHFAGVSDL